MCGYTPHPIRYLHYVWANICKTLALLKVSHTWDTNKFSLYVYNVVHQTGQVMTEELQITVIMSWDDDDDDNKIIINYNNKLN